MAIPARHLILDNVADTLAKIRIAQGYKTTVATVARCIKDWDSVGASEMPWLGFMPGQERYTYFPGSTIRTELDVEIVGHVNAATSESRTIALSDLVDDVIAVLNVDTTRDANAITTTVVSSQTDEGDPDNLDSRGGSGSVHITVRVAYDRTTGAT